MTILGLGTDITCLPRFINLIKSNSSKRVLRLATRILHSKYEKPRFIELYNNNNSINNNHTNDDNILKSAKFLATAWACKEALYKSLDPIDQMSCRFNHWHKSTLESIPSFNKNKNFKNLGIQNDKNNININNNIDNIDNIDNNENNNNNNKLLNRFKKPCLLNENYFKHHPSESFHLSLSHDGDYIFATVIREQRIG